MLNNSSKIQVFTTADFKRFIKPFRWVYHLIIKLSVFLILTATVILAVGFASLNAELVTVHYYIGKAEMSLAVLLTACFAVGVFIGVVVLFPSFIRLKWFNKRLEKCIKRTEETLEKIKSLQNQSPQP